MISFQPEGWFDIMAYLIVGIPAIIAAVGVILARKTQKSQVLRSADNAEVTAEVLYEVQNAHTTNLRDDIDSLGAAIKEGFHNTREDIRDLRQELCTERIERIEGDRK